MKVRVAVLVCASLASRPILAADQPDKCFVVTTPSHDGAPYGSILLDACDGRSWVLIRQAATMQDVAAGNYAWEWEPIGVRSGDGKPSDALMAAINAAKATPAHQPTGDDLRRALGINPPKR